MAAAPSSASFKAAATTAALDAVCALAKAVDIAAAVLSSARVRPSEKAADLRAHEAMDVVRASACDCHARAVERIPEVLSSTLAA